jgi:hypothetical protein
MQAYFLLIRWGQQEYYPVEFMNISVAQHSGTVKAMGDTSSSPLPYGESVCTILVRLLPCFKWIFTLLCCRVKYFLHWSIVIKMQDRKLIESIQSKTSSCEACCRDLQDRTKHACKSSSLCSLWPQLARTFNVDALACVQKWAAYVWCVKMH